MWVKKQKDDGSVVTEAQGGGSEVADVTWEFAENVDIGFTRGTADTDRTALKLRRSDGTLVYIYVDTGTTVLCSATHP